MEHGKYINGATSDGGNSIMQDLAKLSDFASYSIETLIEEGHDVTPADIVELSALGWGVESPETRRLLARGAPVEIAGVYLWPMTLYAQEWFDRVGCKLPGKAETYALAYCMAHGRGDSQVAGKTAETWVGKLKSLVYFIARDVDDGEPLKIDGRTAIKEVKRWRRSLKCTFGELNVAISQVLMQDEEPEVPVQDTGGMTIGDFSAFLASALGATPDYWERQCSAGYTHAVLDAMVRQNTAEGQATSTDPKMKANMVFAEAVEKIRKRRGG